MLVQASYIKTMLSGITLTTDAVDLGSSFRKVYLDIPTKGIGDIYIQGAAFANGTFKRVCRDQVNTTTTHTDFMIASGITSRIVPVQAEGIRFLKIEHSSGSTGDIIYNIICGE